MNNYNCNWDDAKTLIIRLMYMGTVENWLKDLG